MGYEFENFKVFNDECEEEIEILCFSQETDEECILQEDYFSPEEIEYLKSLAV